MLKFQLENYETLQENTDNRTVYGSWPLRTLKPLKKNNKFSMVNLKKFQYLGKSLITLQDLQHNCLPLWPEISALYQYLVMDSPPSLCIQHDT